MLKRILAAFLFIALNACLSVSHASEPGLFAALAGEPYADERLAAFDSISEKIQASTVTESGVLIEVRQACYVRDRVFIAYQIGDVTELIGLHEGSPEETLGGIQWSQVLEDWITGEVNAPDFPDVKKEHDWLDGKGRRWLTSPYCYIQDGLVLEDGTLLPFVAGTESKQKDGSVIGWRECVVPEEKITDTLAAGLYFSCENAIKYQDRSTFRAYYTDTEPAFISFVLTRRESIE